jgi:arylsulfatase A-like enzyme
MLGRSQGFAQGFGFWHEEPRPGEGRVTGRVASAVAKNALTELEGAQAPFFLMVHLFDPHWAYATYPAIGFAGEPPERLREPLAMSEARELLPFSSEELAWLVDAYDEEVWITDRSLGELLGTLEVLGKGRETLVVVVGDHGEEIGERGRIGHTASLHEEVMRVPLLLSGRGLPEGLRVAEPVSAVSLAPTLLDLLGLPVGGGEFDAPSLAPRVRGERASGPLWPTARVHRALGGRGSESVSLSAVVGERYKLIRDLEAQRTLLFDLREDPGEQRDLSAELPDVVRELERHLEAD